METDTMLPNFFIAGTPKSGTTSLSNYLSEHPQVYMSSVKEPNYFSYDEIVEQNLYYSEKGISSQKDYKALFKNTNSEIAVGEASVSYLFYKSVPLKIKTAIPDAKIIIILRNPVDRAFSHYLMDFRLGYINIPFEDTVFNNTNHRLAALYYQQYVELGLYYAQLKRYFNVFEPSQLKIFLNEDLRDDMSKVINSVCNFLNIDPDCPLDLSRKYNVYKTPKNFLIEKLYASKPARQIARKIFLEKYTHTIKNLFFKKRQKPKLQDKTREYLTRLYMEDINQTGMIISRDLSCWLTKK